MKINSSKTAEYNFPEELQPLFDAMKDGRTIKKVVCMAGTNNADKPELDFVFENFISLEYHIAFAENDGKKHDYVRTNTAAQNQNEEKQTTFYMCWVKSFELCEYIELPDGKSVPVENYLSV